MRGHDRTAIALFDSLQPDPDPQIITLVLRIPCDNACELPSGDDLKNYGSTKTICAVLDKLGVKYQKRTPMSGLIEKVIANWNGVVNEEVQKQKGVTTIELIVELAKLGVTEATKDGKVKKINDRNFKIGELQKMYEEKKAEEEDEDEEKYEDKDEGK